ncbi:MAG: outer membrane protein assembly factor [Planctomycetota bacterium]|jgi:outer membrane protein insertion porin family
MKFPLLLQLVGLLSALILLSAGCVSGPPHRLAAEAQPSSKLWQQPVVVSAPTPPILPSAGPQPQPESTSPALFFADHSRDQESGFDTPRLLPSATAGSASASASAAASRVIPDSQAVVRAQSPVQQPQGGGQTLLDPNVRPMTYQYPTTPTLPPGQVPGAQLGTPTFPGAVQQSYGPAGPQSFPQNYADLDVYVTETMTGRINLGGAYNSDNGLVGQFIIDERNFDLFRFPRSFREITDGTAWRGAGQGFRLELVPGNQVQRYLVSFTEPYLFDSSVSLSVSGFLFSRNYFDWNEQRLGGRVSLGYRLTPDVSVSAGLRMENVELSDPRVNTSPELNESLGNTDLYMAQFSLTSDTRDHPFLPTDGQFLSLTYSQGFGEVDFPRGDIEVRRYRLMYQRPDGSGRHTVSYGTRLGFSGSGTPIFENYFAGGFSTMRGFEFRGASPLEGGVRVGGEFQWLNTLEYMFPITADDMIKAVAFCDFGTVEREIDINWNNFRVAPGFGFRVHMPAAGMGAPLAFDFAFPVSSADGDEKQVFSFYMGMIR